MVHADWDGPSLHSYILTLNYSTAAKECGSSDLNKILWKIEAGEETKG